MFDNLLIALVFAAAIGAGLIAGVFFAFSTFVMRALTRLSVAEGIAAMQSINIVVINPTFLGVFLGTALLSAIVGASSLLRWQAPDGIYLLVGGVLYVVGTFGVTMMFNVPLNNSLAAVIPSDPEAAKVCDRYIRQWTAWNHVRTVAALSTMGSFVLALWR